MNRNQVGTLVPDIKDQNFDRTKRDFRQPARQVMTEQKHTRTVVVTNPAGLHVRSADTFVKLASQYRTNIEVIKDNLRVNGKSILDVLMLAASEGTVLSIEASGEDATDAVEALVRLVEQNFGETDSPG
jgi:phosphocarrier protein